MPRSNLPPSPFKGHDVHNRVGLALAMGSLKLAMVRFCGVDVHTAVGASRFNTSADKNDPLSVITNPLYAAWGLHHGLGNFHRAIVISAAGRHFQGYLA